MEAARLHFPNPDTEPLRLVPGAHGIGGQGEHLGVVAVPAQAILMVQVDQRGLWMHVSAHTAACVHVNGRRVYQIAQLRCGDVVHVDAAELRLVAPSPPPPCTWPAVTHDTVQDPCWVLRGLGGHHHGRCFTLDRPRQVGYGAQANLPIDEPTWAGRPLHLERVHQQVIVHNPGVAADCRVNGHPVATAILAAGDQLVLNGRHRFVLEVPHASPPPVPPLDHATGTRPSVPSARARASWPLWLLVAAALLAAALSGLLLLGTAA